MKTMQSTIEEALNKKRIELKRALDIRVKTLLYVF